MLREEILKNIERDSRVDVHELAVRLGAADAEVVNAMKEMEDEGIRDLTASQSVSICIPKLRACIS